MLGKKATFEEIEHNNSTINMGEFMKFCKDFKINLGKQKSSEVFKKNATNSIEMVQHQFVGSLGKLFKEIANEEVEKLQK